MKLKDPDTVLQFFEHYGMDPNNIPSEPHKVFFGRVVSYCSYTQARIQQWENRMIPSSAKIVPYIYMKKIAVYYVKSVLGASCF